MVDNRENDHMYFIEMGIREFAQEASYRFANEFNLDYGEVKFFFDDLVGEMLDE